MLSNLVSWVRLSFRVNVRKAKVDRVVTRRISVIHCHKHKDTLFVFLSVFVDMQVSPFLNFLFKSNPLFCAYNRKTEPVGENVNIYAEQPLVWDNYNDALCFCNTHFSVTCSCEAPWLWECKKIFLDWYLYTEKCKVHWNNNRHVRIRGKKWSGDWRQRKSGKNRAESFYE